MGDYIIQIIQYQKLTILTTLLQVSPVGLKVGKLAEQSRRKVPLDNVQLGLLNWTVKLLQLSKRFTVEFANWNNWNIEIEE